MIAALQRNKAELSAISDQISLLQRSIVGCLIMLQNQNNQQAVSDYRDSVKMLHDIQETMQDLDRKIKGEES